jgi:hypothetical protein
MAIGDEQYHLVGFDIARTRLLREISLYELINLDENNVKKKIGQMAQESGLSRDMVLGFVKRLMSEIAEEIKEVSDMVQNITFK